MVITKDLGAVSAYAYAVEQGYQGTEEEFAELMARQATVAEEAAASADAAAESASEAQASAEQAEQSAQSIEGDVERAEQAATTATGKATEAATSATTANGAAQTATGKASEASASATAAANSASAAATSASNAAASATAAQTAQTAAETAQGKAEDAQAAAEAAAASIDPDTLVKKTELENYARIDGSYETMTVGNAEQLVSTVGIDDKVPYLFRTSGGSADIGNRETDKIVGGTVCWNQYASELNSTNWGVEGGVTVDYSDGVVTFSSTVAGNGICVKNTIPVQSSHKYFIQYDVKGEAGLVVRYVVSTTSVGKQHIISTGNVWERVTAIVSNNLSTSKRLYVFVVDSTYTNLMARNVQLIDLTQMFGSTIADYIYSLETATAGAGVAWFKKLFPKPYYEYNVGELLSVNTSQHKMVGFNQWDEVSEVGAYDNNTGEKTSIAGRMRSANAIRVFPDTAYCLTRQSGGFYCYWYDASGNFIQYNFYNTDGNGKVVVTSPSNAGFLRFYIYGSASDISGVCINLSWDGERDGEYEPYQEWVYPLDSSLTLRGIPKLDASNNLYYDGDRYLPDGTVERRYASVDLGSLTYTATSMSNNRTAYTTPFSGLDGRPFGSNASPSNELCPSIISTSKFTQINQSAASWAVGSFVYVWSTEALPGNTIGFITNTNDYADAATFKTAMSGVYLVYELATPTTETATPYQNPQNVDDFGTEEYVTDSIVPVGHETFYQANLKAKLEMAPNSPDGDGDYIVRQANGLNSYVPLAQVKELPDLPTTDGTYTLKATVASGTPTYTWVSDTAESEG